MSTPSDLKRVAVRGLTVVALLAQTGAPEMKDFPGGQQLKSFQRTVTRAVEMSYLLYLPRAYDTEVARRWPLILFLHGAPERGTDINRVVPHSPATLAGGGPDFGFIVVSPQCPAGESWEGHRDTLLALLGEVCATHRVDTTRVYLTGFSMGGYGVWGLGLVHPERFAAIAPICGGGEVLSINLPRKDEKALRTLRVWAFHGAQDNMVKPEESRRMVDALNGKGGNAKLTVFPDKGHLIWQEIHQAPELYAWFLLHQRLPAPAAQSTDR